MDDTEILRHLSDVLERFGNDPVSSLGALRDLCWAAPERKLNLLSYALQAHVPEKLAQVGRNVDRAFHGRLVATLCDTRGIEPSLAKWAVGMCAAALGKRLYLDPIDEQILQAGMDDEEIRKPVTARHIALCRYLGENAPPEPRTASQRCELPEATSDPQIGLTCLEEPRRRTPAPRRGKRLARLAACGVLVATVVAVATAFSQKEPEPATRLMRRAWTVATTALSDIFGQATSTPEQESSGPVALGAHQPALARTAFQGQDTREPGPRTAVRSGRPQKHSVRLPRLPKTDHAAP